ncbi:MAG: major capsid protein [Clostridiales bacterium]|nr:major capsid protein [Clostridiales bacterium]
MKLSDVFTAEAIALNYTNAASNSIPYLGTGLFPARKKAGLDLKWLKGHNGLPVSLMPSAFDAKSTFRDRVGISMTETQMPFFRESMLVKEQDEQEIMRVQDSNDPYAVQVLENIFNDAQTLIGGANVVPERMIMQLLAPIGGRVGIDISANGVNYTYDYDPSGAWKAEHYLKIVTEADKWSAADTCDPVKNIEDALDAQEAASGNRPEILLMSKNTFNLLKNSAKVRSGVLAQNITANVNYTTQIVTNYIQEALNVTIVVYNKQFKDETGTAKKFYPDNIVMMLPGGALGSTWYGTTPEERTLAGTPGANVSIVNTGVAVAVTTTSDPVNTKTTVSEIVLPSFEQLDMCYALECC